MSTRIPTITFTAILFASLVAIPQIATSQPSTSVATVGAVISRDGGGRVQRFTDSANREFAVSYDSQQRLKTVEATLRPHISDILTIGYAPEGKLVTVRFRSGYTMSFDTRPDGTQVVRDSRGGALIRVGQASRPVDAAATEQSTKLASTLARFESLMSALGQAMR